MRQYVVETFTSARELSVKPVCYVICLSQLVVAASEVQWQRVLHLTVHSSLVCFCVVVDFTADEQVSN